MKKRFVCLLFVFVCLLSSCSSASGESVHPDYYEVGTQALGVAEAYLANRIDLSEAKQRIETISSALDSLPLLPENDPQYEQSDLVQLYASAVCNSFGLQRSEERTLQLQEDLRKYTARLNDLLGLSSR